MMIITMSLKYEQIFYNNKQFVVDDLNDICDIVESHSCVKQVFGTYTKFEFCFLLSVKKGFNLKV